MRKLVAFIMMVVIACFGVTILSQEIDPLLQLLVEKKVLTAEEAQSVQKEYDKRKEKDKVENKKVVEETVKSTKPPLPDALKGLTIGGTYFISYQNGNSFDATQEDGSKAYNKFVLKRGYLDVRKEITPYLNVRFTPDVTLDSAGDYKCRVKFLYADFHFKGNKYFNSPYIRFGTTQFPWFDFEENANAYRMQDPHFMDRVGLGQTADTGILFGVGFGETLPEDYLKNVSSSYAAKWGSFQLGIYNGGGFTSGEKNTNKVIASHLAFRPLPELLTGLQLHYFGVRGKGNVADDTRYTKDGQFKGKLIYPDWNLDAFAISYQHPWFTLIGQYFEGTGNAAGNRYYNADDYEIGKVAFDDIFKGYSQKGYSFFGEVKMTSSKKWRIIGRYDYYDPDTKDILILKGNEDIQKRYIFGVANFFFKNNAFLLDYQRLTHTKKYNLTDKIPDENRYQLTLQIKF